MRSYEEGIAEKGNWKDESEESEEGGRCESSTEGSVDVEDA